MKRILVYSLANLEPKKSYALIKRIFKEKTYNEIKSGKIKISQMEFKVDNETRYMDRRGLF